MRGWVLLGGALATAALVFWSPAADASVSGEAPAIQRDAPCGGPGQPLPAGEETPDPAGASGSDDAPASKAPSGGVRDPGAERDPAGEQARGPKAARAGPGGLAVAPFDPAVLWKLAGGMAAVVAAAVGLLWLYRRWGGGRARLSGAGGLQVLGRTALSPKHFVYVLRLEDRRIVVGVCGDRMTTLAAYEEPPPPAPLARRAEPRAAEPMPPAAEPGPSPAEPRLPPAEPRLRGTERSAKPPSRAPAITDDDLLPYRRQVSRLRDMLRNQRGELSDRKDPF